MNIHAYLVLTAATYLRNKPDRTPEEERAYRSFKKMIKAVIIILIITFAIAVPYTLTSDTWDSAMPGNTRFSGTVRNGIVSTAVYSEEGPIVYEDIPISELDIDTTDISEGDEITFLYDRENQLIRVMPEEERMAEVKFFAFTLIGFVAVMSLISLIVCNYTIGKEFRQWFLKVYLLQAK